MCLLKIVNYALLSALLLLSQVASSADLEIHGFISAYGGINLEKDKVTYGYKDKFTFQPDSLAGLQFMSKLNDKVSATVQLVSEAKNDYDIEAQWAFIEYKFNETWSLQTGRIRIPWYMMSDYLNAKKSYHWVRAPSGVYSAPFGSFEGVKLRHKTLLGDWESDATLTFGNYHNSEYILSGSTLPPTLFEAEDWLALTWRLNSENSHLFLSHHFVEMSLEPDNIKEALAEIGADYPDIAENIRVKNKSTTITALGYIYDNGDFLFQTEVSRFDLDGYFSVQNSFYASVGKYFDGLLIHITYEKDENKPHLSYADDIPQGDIKDLATLVLNTQKKDNNVVSIGAKYDIDINTAFKIQLSSDKTNGIRSKVFTVGLDYLF